MTDTREKTSDAWPPSNLLLAQIATSHYKAESANPNTSIVITSPRDICLYRDLLGRTLYPKNHPTHIIARRSVFLLHRAIPTLAPREGHLFWRSGLDLPLNECIGEEEPDDANNTEYEDDARILLCKVFLSFEELVHMRISAACDKRVVNSCHLRKKPEQESLSINVDLNWR
jgi:hypothetical protein